MKTMSSLTNKLLALLLCFALMLSMLPVGVLAVEGTSYGTVTPITSGVEIGGTAENVQATYTGTPTWHPADPSINRLEDGWWIGMNLVAPDTLVLDEAKYTINGTERSYKDNADGAEKDHIELWGCVNESFLRSANLTDGLCTYVWTFDWDGDGTFEQTITLDAVSKDIILHKDNEQVYPAAAQGFGQVSALTSGLSISGAGSANVSATIGENITLEWVEQDLSVGRYQDGWWAGMQINAPAGISSEQLKEVHYMSGDNLLQFWASKDSADDATGHFMTMWVPLNNLLSGNMSDYSYRFDWNNDGLFEQTLALSVDGSKVKLNKNGVQVYPELGKVTSYNGGTVVGSGTGEVSVTVNNASLTWSETNTAIGRYQDAWWAGIEVTAPESIPAAVLTEAKYQVKNSPNTSWDAVQEASSFEANKDGERFIGLWMPLKPSTIETFKENGRNITLWYRFDWDNDGVYEQYITFAVDPNGNIELQRKDQADFKFTIESPDDVWVGVDKYDSNPAIGGSGTGAVTYAIIDEAVNGTRVATIDPSTGVLTPVKAGKVTVQATKAADAEGFYNEAKATYTITFVKKDQNPAFEKSNPSAITYEPGKTFENAVTSFFGDVTYSIADEAVNGSGVATIDPSTGKLSIQKAGTVTVKASIDGNEKYNGTELTYTLVINKADQTGFSFDVAAVNVTYNDNDNKLTKAPTGGQSSQDATYKSSDTTVAMVDNDGVVTVLKAGTVTITATKPADDCYNETEASYQLNIEKDCQDFTFEEGTAKTATYGIKSYTNEVKYTGKHSVSSTLTYSLGANDLGAEINATTGEITFSESNGKVGTLTVTATKAEDDCYKETSQSYTLQIDYHTPSDTPTATGDQLNTSSNWFTDNVKIQAPTGYKVSLSNGLETATWAESVPFVSEGGDKTAKVYLKEDSTGFITDEIQVTGINTDTVKPEITIEYSTPILQKVFEQITFGFYKANAKVTVTVTDESSGADRFEMTYNRQNGASSTNKETETFTAASRSNDNTLTKSFTIDPQARGSISVVAYDRAGNRANKGDSEKIIVVDSVSPEINVTYALADGSGSVNYPYNACAVKATITVNEANFFEGLTAGSNNDQIIHDFVLTAAKTDDAGNTTVTEYLCANAAKTLPGAQTQTIEWTKSGDTYTTSITFAEDGDYVLSLSYDDFSGNASSISGSDGNNGSINYQSQVITVDSKAPVIEVSFDNNSALNENVYKDNRTATVKVTEHNFRAADFVASVTAKDILGKDVSVTDFAAYAANDKNWTHEGNVHTLKLKFSKDAAYSLDVSYQDLAGNKAADFTAQSFVVDHTGAENIHITYSTPVFEKIIETLSFGFYKAEMVVTVSAEDMTSGVDYFELTFTADAGTTDAQADNFTKTLQAQASTEDGKTFTASYKLSGQARGSFSVKAFDKAGNSSSSADKDSAIITDTVSPEIQISYAGKDSDTKVRFVDKQAQDVASFALAASALYNGNVVATITVNEENFFEGEASGTTNKDVVHELILKVTRTDDAGKVTVTEYLSGDAVQLVENAGKEKLEWTTDGDTHSAQIEFSQDGDYVLELTYADFSENDASIAGNDGTSSKKTYVSKPITVDKTAPALSVAYSNTDVINTIDSRNYFAKPQSATITVTEHNFRASDVVAAVLAKDFLGADVAVADFAAQLASDKNWIHEGNVHTATVNFTADANYTFDIDVKDLAGNASAAYTADCFTVDTTAPVDLTVSYSSSVMNRILESVTFGYYNAPVTVTISATDVTSGIHHFSYSYIKNAGVSDVNAQLLDQAIQAAQISYDGNKASATFVIPKLDLGRNNQFNGTVSFVAYDCSENYTEKGDNTRIIVDSLSPTATVSFNEPVQNQNGISYYAGNIQGTISINEANFDSKDVKVTVTKDGSAYPVSVFWHDYSVDNHSGSFTLTEDGNYTVSIQYADKSGNRMKEYVSNQLTLDTEAPVIMASNIKANSANKDEKYGFVIEISDTNLDGASMKPVLKAVLKNAQGQYETVEIDLGQAQPVIEGQTYTYTVDNLSEDALYTLTCEAKDLSGNEFKLIVLDDDKAYEQVQFSINRDGSAFSYGDAFTEDLAAKYYVYSVDEDVVIVETNVDPIEEYAVSVNGEELKEGAGYTTELTTEDGQWSKRVYRISKALFAAEGEYSVVVSSTDKADTTAYSDIKGLTMAFVVDQTPPVLTITGLEEGGRYQTAAQTVTLIPTDEGGRLNSLKIVALDANGKALKDADGTDISIRFEMSDEELLNYLEQNGGKVTFTIPEGLNIKVNIICSDCAVNADNLTNEYNELFENITVSPNQLVIFYANKPLFYGTIAGTLGISAMIVAFFKRKQVKKAKV